MVRKLCPMAEPRAVSTIDAMPTRAAETVQGGYPSRDKLTDMNAAPQMIPSELTNIQFNSPGFCGETWLIRTEAVGVS